MTEAHNPRRCHACTKPVATCPKLARETSVSCGYYGLHGYIFCTDCLRQAYDALAAFVATKHLENESATDDGKPQRHE